MSIANYIESELEKFNESIREALAANDINNTREASDSLRIDIDKVDYRFQSIGIFYLEFLDTGRGPSQTPTSNPPFSAISKWVETKMGITDEEENERVTYAVIAKIAKLGTKIFINNGQGIELTKKVEFLRETLNKNLDSMAKAEVLQVLDKYKKIWKQKNNIK